MFKRLLPNKEYEFNLDGDFIHCEKLNEDGPEKIFIQLNGEEFLVSRRWLGLLAHYEVDLTDNRELFSVEFTDCSSRVIGLKCKKLMVLRQPLLFENGFYRIPGFLKFAINRNGDVISVTYRRHLKPSIGPYGYPYVNAYDPDKGRWRSVGIHILLARTFIRNSNPQEKCFVNHKDGNKLNFRLSNFEWSTSRENNVHAVKHGLRNDNVSCLLKNIATGEIQRFDSLAEGFRSIGFNSTKKIVRNDGIGVYPVLFKGNFEFKFEDDNTDWHYHSSNLKNDLKFKGPFEAKHVPSGEIQKSETIVGLSKLIGLSEDQVYGILREPKPRTNNGYYVRVSCLDPWPEEYGVIDFNKIRKISAQNTESGESGDFGSLRQLVKTIGIDKRTLKDRLLTGRAYKGWIFNELSNDTSPIV